MSHFNPILGHFRPILSHFEDFVSVSEQPWAAKACGAVKMGVRERPKPSSQSKRGSKWLNGPQKRNRKANSASGAVVHMVPAMGLHAIRQFPRLLGGRAALRVREEGGGPLRVGRGPLHVREGGSLTRKGAGGVRIELLKMRWVFRRVDQKRSDRSGGGGALRVRQRGVHYA